MTGPAEYYMLEHLKEHLKGKAVIFGIGNILRSDDAAGSLLAQHLVNKVPFQVYDGGVAPENYLGKISRENPDNIIIVDAADFGGNPGEARIVEGGELKTTNLFSTHNASISMLINYLQTNCTADIIILIIQPKTISLGEGLSKEVAKTLEELQSWFSRFSSAGFR